MTVTGGLIEDSRHPEPENLYEGLRFLYFVSFWVYQDLRFLYFLSLGLLGLEVIVCLEFWLSRALPGGGSALHSCAGRFIEFGATAAGLLNN